MKFAPLLPTALLAATAFGHTIVQRISINGVDQGQLFGVRAPDSNNPIQNVNDAGFACNNGITHKDNNIIMVPAGAKVGAWWQHVIGGPQGAVDADNPIASSHKGPIQYYLARVNDAASTVTTGLSWFKVAQDGLSNGKWAVDTMIAQDGWHYFMMPTCVAPGDYLLKVELIALHSAGSSGGVQFYTECAQIRVTGSGTNTGSNFVSFPGAYAQNEPGILINIYNQQGQPYPTTAYPIPGPSPISCSGGSGGGVVTSAPVPTSSKAATPGSTAVPGKQAGLYEQCGGQGWTGPTTCSSGTCKVTSQYYSQCLL